MERLMTLSKHSLSFICLAFIYLTVFSGAEAPYLRSALIDEGEMVNRLTLGDLAFP